MDKRRALELFFPQCENFDNSLRRNISIILLSLATVACVQFGCSTKPLPDIAEAYHDRGNSKLLLEEDAQGAVNDLTQAIEFNPQEASLYISRGMAYLKSGDQGAARKDFEKAESLDPTLKPVLKPIKEEARSR